MASMGGVKHAPPWQPASNKRKHAEVATALDDSSEQQPTAESVLQQAVALVFQATDGQLTFDYHTVAKLFPPSSLVSLDAEHSNSPWLASPAEMNTREFRLDATVLQVAYLIETLRIRQVDSNIVWKTLAEGVQFCNMIRYLNLETCPWFLDDLEMATLLQQQEEAVLCATVTVTANGYTLHRSGRCSLLLRFAWETGRRMPGSGILVSDEKRRNLGERMHKLLHHLLSPLPLTFYENMCGCFEWRYKPDSFETLNRFREFVEEFNCKVFSALQLPRRDAHFVINKTGSTLPVKPEWRCLGYSCMRLNTDRPKDIVVERCSNCCEIGREHIAWESLP